MRLRRLAALFLLCLLFDRASTLAQDSRPVSQPSPAIALNDEALKAADAGRLDEAVALLERAREAAPDDNVIGVNLARIIARRGQARFERSELDEAILDLERALRIAPREATIRVQLAIVLRARGDLFRARRETEKVLADEPKSASAFEELGRIAWEEDELAQALEALDAAIALDPARAAKVAEFRAKVARELEVEKGFLRLERGSFVVKCDDAGIRGVGEAVLDMLDAAEQHARRTLGHAPQRRVSLVLYSRGDFEQATGAHAWAGGLFDGKIRLPVRNFETSREAIRRTIRHEYTHLVVRDLCRRCPIWLNEGLAQLAEEKSPADAERRLAGLPPRRISSLPDSWASIADRELVGELYSRALAFTGWLVNRFGHSAIRDVLGKLAKDGDLRAAVREVFGATLDELEDSWLRDAGLA